MAAGDGLCDERRRARPRRGRPALRARADGRGAPRSIAAPTAQPALGARRRRTARAACCTRTTRPAARSAARSGSARRRCPACATHAHARVVALIVEDGALRGRAVPARRRDAGGGARDAACCWRPAAPARSSARRRTRPSRPATASRWRTAPARRVADLEFVQFHPTALNVPGQPRFLLSEALRGEGARLVNAAGERVHDAVRSGGRSRAARSRVARRSCARRSGPAGPSFCRSSTSIRTFVHERFPLISDACRRAGLDLARDPIPGRPGGPLRDGRRARPISTAGRRSPGCSPPGEVACTGVHGANRLASNSLLEGLVFGARAGRAMRATRVQSSRVQTFRRSGIRVERGRCFRAPEP